MTVVAFDTETFLFGPENLSPRVVCASFATAKQLPKVISNGDQDRLPNTIRRLLSNSDIHLVGHRVAYDLCCVGNTWPDLWPLIFKALNSERVHDTLIQEKLINLATTGDLETGLTGKRLSYSLAAVAKRRLGAVLDGKDRGDEGEDPWRYRYHELDGKPSSEYPKEAHDYALMDAKVTLEVYFDQISRTSPDIRQSLRRVEPFHTNSSVSLYLISDHGLAVDWPAKLAAESEVDAQLGPDHLPLVYSSGVVVGAVGASPYTNGAKSHRASCSRPPKRKGGCTCPPKLKAAQPEKVRVKEKLRPMILETCRDLGIVPKTTDKGAVSTAAEFLEEIAHANPVLEQFLVRAKLIKLKTSYFPNFEWPRASGKPAKVIHPGFDPLKKTGRVSSRGFSKQIKEPPYPSLNIQQADPRIRMCYKPRDGKVFIGADFTSVDLCSLAQTIYDLLGQSTLRDQINSGVDPHSFLGAVLASDGDRTFRELVVGKTNEEGLRTFLERRSSESTFSLPDGSLVTGAQWFKHWRTFAKPIGLGFPGGLGAKTMVQVAAGYGFRITEEEAYRLRDIWFSVYPEMKWYLRKWVPNQVYGKRTLQDGRDMELRKYLSPLGMIRAGCSHTECANGRALQTPAAEGMKRAMWYVTEACWLPEAESCLLGARIVINMHDELVLEVDDDSHEKVSAQADELERLMVKGMSEILPDVTIRAEPVVMTRWSKDAKSTRDPETGLWTRWNHEQH